MPDITVGENGILEGRKARDKKECVRGNASLRRWIWWKSLLGPWAWGQQVVSSCWLLPGFFSYRRSLSHHASQLGAAMWCWSEVEIQSPDFQPNSNKGPAILIQNGWMAVLTPEHPAVLGHHSCASPSSQSCDSHLALVQTLEPKLNGVWRARKQEKHYTKVAGHYFDAAVNKKWKRLG